MELQESRWLQIVLRDRRETAEETQESLAVTDPTLNTIRDRLRTKVVKN